MFAAKGHTAVLQAAIEAVRLGTKESITEESDDTSMKNVRAWSKLMKDSLNQRGSRGETPVMIACAEGSAPQPLELAADKLLSPIMSMCLINATGYAAVNPPTLHDHLGPASCFCSKCCIQ